MKIAQSIKPYLNEIAGRLWSGHASVMVGSGFSKNADSIGNSEKKHFPDWHQLGDIFYEKVNGRKPDGKAKYLNVLKLADEVQAAFGRTALEKLLQENIPDLNYQPAKLHEELLKLPWNDVFTTNYDTLLERTRERVIERRYDVVVNKEDLGNSDQPRIIKLHGSFTSNRPFIITEEDYRRYPDDFGPFVNTVQQSLLENTLCLIGFSGDDPNFLRWIGWIRDNVGSEYSPKIYLVGIINLTDAQKKLLQKRNIVIVNMAECDDIGTNEYYKGLKRFIDFLSSKEGEKNKVDWPKDYDDKVRSKTKEGDPKSGEVAEIIQFWKKQRMEYPGWVVLPEEGRKHLWRNTENWIGFISEKDELENELDLYWAKEILWRMERCLSPIWNEQLAFFEKILKKYSHLLKEEGNEGDKEQNVIFIHIALLRYYREEGLWEKWNTLNNDVTHFWYKLTDDQRAQFHYERCLYSLFTFDQLGLQNNLKDWPVNKTLPYEEAKRAGILAEKGDVDQALDILSSSLGSIRSLLNLNPISSDYTLVSQESYVLFLYQHVKNVVAFSGVKKDATTEEISQIKTKHDEETNNRKSDSELDNQHNIDERRNLVIDVIDDWNNLLKNKEGERRKEWNDYLFSIRSELRKYEAKEYRKRLSELESFNCNALKEFTYFEKVLKTIPEPREIKEITYGFDLGNKNTSIHFGPLDSGILDSYRFLRFLEDVGMPVHISGSTFSKNAIEGAINRLSNNSSYWIASIVVRLNDSKNLEYVYSREALSKMSTHEVDNIIFRYSESLKNASQEIAYGNSFFASNLGIVLAKMLPEVLSRLSSKCSSKGREKLLDILFEIFNSPYRAKYEGLAKFVQRVMKSFSDEEVYFLTPKLLQIPIPKNPGFIEERDLINPISYLHIRKERVNGLGKLNLAIEDIKDQVRAASSSISYERVWGISSLAVLYQLGLLTSEQEIAFAEVLWKYTDSEYQLPTDTNFYEFAFLMLPHPENVNPMQLVKKYIEKDNFPIHAEKKEDGVSMTGGFVRLCHNIIGANEYIEFTNAEAESILKKIEHWWDSDKKHLKDKRKEPFGDIQEEFRKRFSMMVDVLSHVVVPTLSSDIKQQHSILLKRLIKEIEEYKLPCLNLKLSFLKVNIDNKESVIFQIRYSFSASSEEIIRNSFDALLLMLKMDFGILKNQEISSVIGGAAQKILWRHASSLALALNYFTIIASKGDKYFNENIKNCLITGLGFIEEETSMKNGKLDFNERMYIRLYAIGLARILYNNYSVRNETIPEELIIWEKIAESEDEFVEIRNRWKNLSR